MVLPHCCHRGSRSSSSAIRHLLRGTWEELHIKLPPTLSNANPGLRERLVSCGVPVADDVKLLLALVDSKPPAAWGRACEADTWVSARAYYCPQNYITGARRRVHTADGRIDADAEAALADETQALRAAVLGCTRGPALSLCAMAHQLQVLQVIFSLEGMGVHC